MQGHIGRTHNGGAVQYSAIAWHVDTVTDAFGNQMTYHYYTWNTSENIQWWNTDHWTSFALTTRKNRINDIKYNYPTRVTSLPAADTVARLTSTPATRIAFRPANTTYGSTLINSIFIYHGSGALPISEYRIDTTGVLVDSPGCVNYDTQPNTLRQSHTRIVKSIRRYVNTDGDAATNDAGYALPPTTFYYGSNLNNQNEVNPLRHFTKNSQPCFSFLYLHGYKNGYGGSARFTYSSDNRSAGDYFQEAYNRYTWPTIGYSYGYNNPVKYQDPTGHRPTDGCEYEGCELDDYLDPNETWITAQGQVSLIDPVLAAQYPGDFTWEEALFTATGLVGISALPATVEYGVSQVVWPALVKAGGTIASWLCLKDGDCGNEAQTVANVGRQSINWLTNQANRVNHIINPNAGGKYRAGHDWSQLINYSGNQSQDYQALQPYLDAFVQHGASTTTATGQSVFAATVNNVPIEVIGNMQNGVFVITDAWIVLP